MPSIIRADQLESPGGHFLLEDDEAFVVSNADPGVHNWVDPCGLTSGILTVRMAA